VGARTVETWPGRLDYLVIGHVTLDRAPGGGLAVGGTAAYAARTARALGCRVGVITSADEGVDLEAALPGVATLRIPASATTTFENRYTPSGRVQFVRATANPLGPDCVPPAWRQAAVVHVGPVAGECDPGLVSLFPGSFLGVTPQGWMRRWDDTGRVEPVSWRDAEAVLPRVDGVVLSEEDMAGDEEALTRWTRLTPLLALTRGPAGCRVYADGKVREFPGFPAIEEDPTGAGDVFASVFFTQLEQGATPWQAAWLANRVAAVSVTRPGLEGVPSPDEVSRCLARCGS
jgi:sugar/nucleoside kinase (ribokinase family)